MRTRRQKMSLFLIMLIISLPIYSAFVMGADIRNIQVMGTDRVDGFVKKDDTLTIIAEASLNGEQVTTDDIKIDTTYSLFNFNQGCVNLGNNYYRCSHQEGISDASGRLSFTLRLYDKTGREVKSQFQSYIVDSNAPNINVEQQPTQDGKEAIIKYSVTDTACSNCNNCVGLKSIKIGQKTITQNFTSCTYEGEEKIALSKEGIQSITLTATDKFGQQTDISSTDFEVDLKSPKLISQSLSFFRGSAEYNYVAGRGTGMDMIIRVQDEKSDINTAFAKLKSINEGYGDTLYEADICQEVDEKIFECVWQGIVVKFGDVPFKNPILKFSAKDEAGNEMIASQQYNFKVDKENPLVELVGTDGCFEKFCYVRPGINKFTAKIIEKDSGFNALYNNPDGTLGHGIVFDLNSIIPGLTFARAANCTKQGSSWECSGYADVGNLPENQVFKIYVTDDSKDDVGNQVTGKQTGVIQVDAFSPKVINYSVFSVGTTGKKTTYSQAGDMMSAEAYVLDKTPVTALGNFSEILGPSKNAIPAACTQLDATSEGILWHCEWNNAGQIITPGLNNVVDFQMQFIDIVKNSAVERNEISILTPTNAEPNHWSVGETELIPSRIDKQMLPLLSMDVYAAVPLKAHSSGAKVLESQLIGGCTGDTNYLDADPYVVQSGANTQLIKFKLKRRTISENTSSLKFECDIGIISQYDNAYVSKLETETVSITMPLYNMPLGKIDENTHRLIADAKSDTLYKIADKLKILEKFLDWTEKACKIGSIINKIGMVISIFKQTSTVLQPGGTAAADTINAEGLGFWSYVMKMNRKFVIPFCELGSCRRSYTHLSNNKLLSGFTFNYDQFSGAVDYDYYNRLKASKLPNGKADPVKVKEADDYLLSRKGNNADTMLGLGVQDYLEGRGFSDVGVWPSDPGNSLILSIIALCPAGIIKGLKRYRQIKCGYLYCLQNDVPQGRPVSDCTAQHEYLQCKYVFGEIFQLVPYVHIWRRLGNQVKALLSDPLSLVFGVGGYLCNPANEKTSFTQGACEILHYSKMLGKLAGYVNQIQGNRGADVPANRDMCAALDRLDAPPQPINQTQ